MSMEQRARGKRSLTARLIGPARRIFFFFLLRDIGGGTRSQVHAAAHGLLRLGEPSRANAPLARRQRVRRTSYP